MKKLSLVLAGILLVGGISFAQDKTTTTKTDKKTTTKTDKKGDKTTKSTKSTKKTETKKTDKK